MIRFITATTGRHAKLARMYLDAIVAMQKPVRLLASGIFDFSAPASPWEKYGPLLITTMEKSFINVICCEPEKWEGLYTPKKVSVKGQEHKTFCHKNVLIYAGGPDALARYGEHAKKYEVVLHRAITAAAATEADMYQVDLELAKALVTPAEEDVDF